MSDETQNQGDNLRARAHTPEAGPAPSGRPAGEIETHTEVVETVTRTEVEPTAGEAMVGLLARRAALPRKVIDAIERALGAKKWSWDKVTNSRLYEDDHRAQLDAAKLYLEYVVGKPAERELVMTDGNGEAVNLDDVLGSAALRRALARRLEAAERLSVQKGGGIS